MHSEGVSGVVGCSFADSRRVASLVRHSPHGGIALKVRKYESVLTARLTGKVLRYNRNWFLGYWYDALRGRGFHSAGAERMFDEQGRHPLLPAPGEDRTPPSIAANRN
jgi:hypothetical protein